MRKLIYPLGGVRGIGIIPFGEMKQSRIFIEKEHRKTRDFRELEQFRNIVPAFGFFV
jgi:hypothetical protein